MKRVTLKTIAQETGLTVNAVSRALHDKDDISASTKQRVAEVAKRLGYVPDFAASSMRCKKSFTVAIVFDTLFNPYYSIMISHIADALEEYNYDFFTIVEKHEKFGYKTYQKILSRSIDGILSFLEPEDEIVQSLHERNVPITILGRHCGYSEIDYAYSDDVKGGYLAAEYLIAQGCKKILYIADHLTISCAQDRYDGFLECAEQKQVAHGLKLINFEAYSAAVERILTEDGELDGLFCFNDHIAMEAQCVADKLGRKIPIVGYDYISQECKIPGTHVSVGCNKAELAKQAVGMLLDRVRADYEGQSRSVVVPVALAKY